MFPDHNSVLRRTSSGAKRFSFWEVNSQFQAQELASQGWWAAAWFSFGYGFGLALLMAQLTSGVPTRPTFFGIVCGIYCALIILGAMLAFFIRFRQPRWASMVLALWAALEALLSLLLFFVAGVFIVPRLVVNVVVVMLAVRSLHGAFRLAVYRRQNRNPDELHEVFS